MENDGKDPQKLRGIYLLPNLLTTGALFAGFYAVVHAMRGKFDAAAVAIYIAMILDGLDGRVARLTNTQSSFGAEYDSLSDMLAFGVAPALLMYSWGLQSLGKIGWLVAFLYVASVALRLARFNIQTETISKKFFSGLPSPTAAGVLAGLVWVASDYGYKGKIVAPAAAVVTVIVSLLMVSTYRYYSFKELDFKGKVPFFAILIVVLLYIFISLDPPWVLFTIFSLYTLAGIFYTIYSAIRLRKKQHGKRKTNNI